MDLEKLEQQKNAVKKAEKVYFENKSKYFNEIFSSVAGKFLFHDLVNQSNLYPKNTMLNDQQLREMEGARKIVSFILNALSQETKEGLWKIKD